MGCGVSGSLPTSSGTKLGDDLHWQTAVEQLVVHRYGLTHWHEHIDGTALDRAHQPVQEQHW